MKKHDLSHNEVQFRFFNLSPDFELSQHSLAFGAHWLIWPDLQPANTASHGYPCAIGFFASRNPWAL